MNSSGVSVIALWRVLPLAAVVLPAEGDAALVHREQPAVGDGHAVRVARQVGQHRLRPGERPLGVDHPLALAQRREPGLEGLRRRPAPRARRRTAACRPRAAAAVPRGSAAGTAATARAPAGRTPAGRRPRSCRRAPARRRARCRARAGGASAPSPRCAAPAWRRCARPGAWGRRRWLQQRLGGHVEQQAVERGLVLVRDVGDRRRQREDHVVVLHRQQIGLARIEPALGRAALALRAVPVAAGVVGDLVGAAAVAAQDVATQRRACGTGRWPTSP